MNQDPQIVFSVVIPVYNRMELLRRAVSSVLAQSFTQYEIVIVDDGSASPVGDTLSEVPFEKLKYIKTPNMGAAVARNIGISLAKGQWIAFLDSDDVWLPQKLQRVYEHIGIHGDTFCYYSGFRFVNSSDGKMINEIIEPKIPSNYTDALKVGNPILAFSSFVASRNKILEVNGLDKTFKARQDVDLYMRLSKISSFICIPEVLSEFYVNAEDRITSNFKNRLQGFISYYDKYSEMLSFSNKSYLSKRIVYFAYRTGKWGDMMKYLIRAVPSILFKVK